MNGTLKRVDGRDVLCFERHYPHPPRAVWQALVEPDQLAQWFPSQIEGERRVGAALRFVFPGDAGPVLTGTFRVFDPPRLLEFTWGKDVLRWELSPTAQGCRLVFTTTLEARGTAPRDATGWHLCFDQLALVVDGKPVPRFPSDRFAALYPQYQKSLGLGAFPPFLEQEEGGAPAELGHDPALAGRVFQGADGVRIGMLRALHDSESAEYLLDRDAYICVVEGTYTLRLGGNELALAAGTEFHVPSGGRVSARVTEGTRFIYALAGQPPERG